MEFWENHKQYTQDFDLFLEYWNKIETLSLDLTIEQLEGKLMEKDEFLERYKMLNSKTKTWSDAREFVFYEDIDFVLEQLKRIRNGKELMIVPFLGLPNKNKRERKLLDFIIKSFRGLKGKGIK